MTSVLVGAFALLIGGLLGLFGGGGSILAVPVLVHVAHLESKEAIAMSLLVVGATSIVGMLRHATAGNVDWKAGATFAPFAMIGSLGGGIAAAWIPGSVLLMLFSVMMLVTSVAMLRGKRTTEESKKGRAPLWLIALEGLGIGAFTGLVGAGGGFLVVPTLMLLGGLSMHRAVGTSLLVIAAKSFTGFAGYVSHVEVDMVLAATMVGLAIVGTLVGSALSSKLPAARLREGFAYFVLAMGVGMVLEPLGWSPMVLGACALAAVLTASSLKSWTQQRQEVEHAHG